MTLQTVRPEIISGYFFPLYISFIHDLFWSLMLHNFSIYELFLIFVWKCYGACIGSFFHVLISRRRAGIPLFKKSRSFCPGCGCAIPIWRNIPIVSYTTQGGKCAKCRVRIPLSYLAAELGMGGVFLTLASLFTFPLAVSISILASAVVFVIGFGVATASLRS